MMKCKVCGVYETNNPDMCKFCYDAIVNYKAILSYVSLINNDKLSVQLTGLLSELSGYDRVAPASNEMKISYMPNGSGQWCPRLLHAPYGIKGRFSKPGGLVEFIDLVLLEANRFINAELVDDSEIFATIILSLVHHAIGEYSYADIRDDEYSGDNPHFRICRPKGLLSGLLATNSHLIRKGIEIPDEVISAVFNEDGTHGRDRLRDIYTACRLTAEVVNDA